MPSKTPRRLSATLTTPVDIAFRVRGTAVQAGYAYPLYSALKQVNASLAQDPQVWFGPIVGVSALGHVLLIGEKTRWLARVDARTYERVLELTGCELRVADNIIRLEAPEFGYPKASSMMHSEFVTLSAEDIGPFAGALHGWLRGYGYHGRAYIGRRRLLSVGRHGKQFGFAVELDGLDEITQHHLLITGIGARRHLGCGMFCPGPLPSWLRTPRLAGDRHGRVSPRLG